ncbi:MAG: DUF2190 family protein [Chloroflexi bacterium]|nr:DUF2190 family protein [Chloroflexota bacterium]
MADIAVTAAQVAVLFPHTAEVYSFIAAETITAGQAVYFTSAGKVGIADANASGKQQVRGIALNGAGAGQAVDVVKRGHVAGFTLGTYNTLVYLSDNAGALADAAGTVSAAVGRIVALSDSALSKALYVDLSWTAVYA